MDNYNKIFKIGRSFVIGYNLDTGRIHMFKLGDVICVKQENAMAWIVSYLDNLDVEIVITIIYPDVIIIKNGEI